MVAFRKRTEQTKFWSFSILKVSPQRHPSSWWLLVHLPTSSAMTNQDEAFMSLCEWWDQLLWDAVSQSISLWLSTVDPWVGYARRVNSFLWFDIGTLSLCEHTLVVIIPGKAIQHNRFLFIIWLIWIVSYTLIFKVTLSKAGRGESQTHRLFSHQ